MAFPDYEEGLGTNMANTLTRNPATLSALADAAAESVWQAVKALADAADQWQALVVACTNPDSAEEAGLLAMAVEWRDDVNAARGYLAGHHRLQTS